MPFLTRDRVLRLLLLVAVLTVAFWAIIRPDPEATNQDSLAGEAGYNVGYAISTPLVLALITTAIVALVWRWRVRRR